MSQTKTQLVEGLSINTSAPADALAIGDNGEFGIAGNNYGISGQVLTSQGSGSAPQWSTIASDKIEEGNTSAEVVDTGSDGHFKVVTEGTERARIDSSGRLLVGLTTGNNRNLLQIQGDADNGATGVGGISLRRGHALGSIGDGSNLGQIDFCMSDGGVAARILGEAEGAAATNDYPGRLEFYTTEDSASSPTERMRITSDGTLKVGTTSATPANCSIFTRSNSSDFGIVDQPTTSVGYPMGFYNSSGTGVGYIETTASATNYVTSSDYRLKENVVPLTGAADRINQLQVHRFNFIVDPDTTFDGFLAHEAQAVVPEAVSGTHNEVEVWKEGEELPDGVSVGDAKLDEDGNTIPVYQGIDQSKLVPLLTAALQEALAKIETLETANASLEARLTALESA